MLLLWSSSLWLHTDLNTYEYSLLNIHSNLRNPGNHWIINSMKVQSSSLLFFSVIPRPAWWLMAADLVKIGNSLFDRQETESHSGTSKLAQDQVGVQLGFEPRELIQSFNLFICLVYGILSSSSSPSRRARMIFETFLALDLYIKFPQRPMSMNYMHTFWWWAGGW